MAKSDSENLNTRVFFPKDSQVSTPKSKLLEGDKSHRSLQTLQTSAHDRNTLVGKHRCLDKVKKGSKSSPTTPMKSVSPLSLSVYEDESSVKEGSDERNDEELSQLVSDEVPDSYWKSLAEERRQALEDSLTENEVLHKEISELQSENDRLNVIAGQAEYLASVLKELIDDEDRDELSSILSDTSILNASTHGPITAAGATESDTDSVDPPRPMPNTSSPVVARGEDKLNEASSKGAVVPADVDAARPCRQESPADTGYKFPKQVTKPHTMDFYFGESKLKKRDGGQVVSEANVDKENVEDAG